MNILRSNVDLDGKVLYTQIPDFIWKCLKLQLSSELIKMAT